jgi:hypothetical protein
MPILHQTLPGPGGRIINMGNVNGVDDSKPFEVPTGPYTTGAVQVKAVQDSSWGTGELTLEVSCDGLNWVTMPAWVGVSTATITADGLYGPLDLSGVEYLRLRVSTADSGLFVRAWFVGKGDA